MSKIDNNLLVKGARGNIGKQFVYKSRGNDTHIAVMPRFNRDAEPTAAQNKVREQFGSAAMYASSVIAQPALKKEYQKKADSLPGRTAYNIAFRDYLKAPVVKSIDTGKYDGSPGSTIGIKAKDDFKVAEVKVSILTAVGVLVEEGNAVLNPLDRNKWIYTATQGNASLASSKISATARDLPGNEGVLEVIV